MKGIIIFACIFPLILFVSGKSNCPCSDASLCNPITTGPRKEFLGFVINNSNWDNYRWEKLTTVASFTTTVNPNLVCKAHQHGARVVLGAFYTVSELCNTTARATWIQQQLSAVQSSFTDGINVDVESPIADQSPEKKCLTMLMKETSEAFHNAMPHSQVSFDVAWSPNCIDGRCYDYVGLAEYSDFLVVMDYDMRSQVFSGPCIASANSPPHLLVEGMNNFTKLNINSNKLVMGLPWYGYNYACIDATNQTICPIQKVPFRGVNCSDAAGRQYDYSYVVQYLANSTTGRLWDFGLQSPYFDWVDPVTKQLHQFWYDDNESLTIKVSLASSLQLRGVAVWNLDSLNYTDQDQVKSIYRALEGFFY